MTRPGGLRRLSLPFAFALVLVPLGAQVVFLGPDLPWGAAAGSDYAGLENDVRTALDLDLLLGTSSRLGVRNLGPFHGYWTAPWYALTGEGVGGMILGTWALNALAAVASVAILAATASRRAAAAGGVALGLALLRAGPAVLSDFYNPALTLPAAVLGTIAAAALARGRWNLLPVVALATSIGSQAHLAAAPGAVTTAVVAGALGVRAGRPARRDLLVTGLVLALLWSPTLIDQVHGSGNAGRLARTVVEGPATPDQPLGRPGLSGSRIDRARTALQLTTLTAPDASAQATLPGLAAGRPGPTTPRTIGAVVVLLASVVAAGLGRRRAPVGSLIIGLGLLGAAATYATTAGLERGFYAYYLAPLVGYGIALVVGVGVVVAATRPVHLHPLAAVVTAMVLVVAMTAASTSSNSPGSPLSVFVVSEPTVQLAFVEDVLDEVPMACRAGGIALEAEFEQVLDVWTLAVAFDKHGVATTVSPELEPFAGPGHRRTGREAVRVWIPPLAEFDDPGPLPMAVDLRRCR